jgi:tetratricopeptide (TPR) repeat protein
MSAQDDCIDISIESSIISIDKMQHQIMVQDSNNLKEIYDNISFEKKCHEEFLEVICTMQNGNEYFIESQIYIKEIDIYTQTYRYFKYSTPNKYEFYGALGNGENLTDILFNSDSHKILLNESINLQTNEITKSYYKKLTVFNKRNTKILNLLSLPYIWGNEQITNENIKIANKLACYLYQNKNYKNSICLLQQILQEFPDNTESLLILGNNYWVIGKQVLAKQYYEKYIYLMTEQSKCKKDQKRVLERIR